MSWFIRNRYYGGWRERVWAYGDGVVVLSLRVIDAAVYVATLGVLSTELTWWWQFEYRRKERRP